MAMNPKRNRSWTIKNSTDLLEKAKRDLARFRKSHEEGDGEQVDHAVNCAITLWHIHDWLWVEKEEQLKAGAKNSQHAFQHWLKGRPGGDLLALCERVANGSKHLDLSKKAELDLDTHVIAKDRPDSMERAIRKRLDAGEKFVGWSLSPEDARDALALADTRGNYIRADYLFEQLVRFWEDLFKELQLNP